MNLPVDKSRYTERPLTFTVPPLRVSSQLRAPRHSNVADKDPMKNVIWSYQTLCKKKMSRKLYYPETRHCSYLTIECYKMKSQITKKKKSVLINKSMLE